MSIYISKHHPSLYLNLPHIMEDRTPYTYLIGWSKHNIWYYGCQYGKGVHPSNLCVKYFTSSSKVHEFINQHGTPDIVQIRKIFNSVHKCCKHESTVLKRIRAVKQSKFLNRTDRAGFPIEYNKVVVKDTVGNTFKVDIQDPLYINKTLNPIQKGAIWSIESKIKASISAKLKQPVSNETKQKLSHALMGHIVSDQTRLKISSTRTGLKFSDNHKANLAKSKSKNTFTFISPNGEIFTHYNIKLFASEHNLSPHILNKNKNTGLPIVMKNKLKPESLFHNTIGWKVYSTPTIVL